MMRTGAPRAIVRSLRQIHGTAHRPALNAVQQRPQWTSRLCTMAQKRPQLAHKPVTALVVRHVSGESVYDKIDKKAEAKVAEKKLEATPELVSSSSTTRPVFSEVGAESPERDVDMMKGIKQDLETIKDTFSLTEVPRQAYILGLAGTLPYLGTSLATVYCAWEINHAEHVGGFLMSGKSAELLLAILEPLQVGYGAVIISFLGAIHWGLEWAGYGGYQGYKRYAIGVFAPAVAWPTILLPPVYALITQFLAFVTLYGADAGATKRGWAPPWYNTYRFVLTFVVGASIVVSLIGRGEIAENEHKLPSAMDRVVAFKENQEEELQKEEEARRVDQVKKEESGGKN